MSFSSDHVGWFVNNGNNVETIDGKNVEIWEFQHQSNDSILSAWAKHFRNHYCFDSEIDYFRNGLNLSRAEYLNTIKFPDPEKVPGPSIRSGDFSEILVSDFLEYISGFWVPRTRYGNKTIRNESTKGSDLIGFQIIKDGVISSEDKLAIFEAKAQFSGTLCKARLQDAVNDSAKDVTRKAESLNAIKQRLYDKQLFNDADKIARFQNIVDFPYKEVYGAVALFENRVFDPQLITSTSSNPHPYANDLLLIVIKGDQMMKLINDLYRRAADEA